MTGPANSALNTIPEALFIPGYIGMSGAPGGDKDEACAVKAVVKFQSQFQ